MKLLCHKCIVHRKSNKFVIPAPVCPADKINLLCSCLGAHISGQGAPVSSLCTKPLARAQVCKKFRAELGPTGDATASKATRNLQKVLLARDVS